MTDRPHSEMETLADPALAEEIAAGVPAVTVLLRRWAAGDRAALDRLTEAVYGELRKLARGYFRRERGDHTLSPTALVNEAFVRLSAGEAAEYTDRVHFYQVAAAQMRRILVDHARRRAAEKRGGFGEKIAFEDDDHVDEAPDDLLALEDALIELAKVDERKARVVELHHFGGMSLREIADGLGVHENTIARDLRLGEAWLHRHITAPD